MSWTLVLRCSVHNPYPPKVGIHLHSLLNLSSSYTRLFHYNDGFVDCIRVRRDCFELSIVLSPGPAKVSTCSTICVFMCLLDLGFFPREFFRFYQLWYTTLLVNYTKPYNRPSSFLGSFSRVGRSLWPSW